MVDREIDMLYQRALERGRRGQIWSMLTRRSRSLLDLTSIEYNGGAPSRDDAGLQTVPISQIRGSEGRSHDFDRDFNPLQDHTEGRWLGIAAARQRGRDLPPVALIQVGDVYFVRDGHHRISVARALGQHAVKATVEACQGDGLLPRATPTQVPIHRSIGQLAGAVRALLQQGKAPGSIARIARTLTP